MAAEFLSVLWALILSLAFPLSLAAAAAPQNQVMGEARFEGATKVERSSGVWVDGVYVGYVDELRGENKVLLLPGEHEISVRQAGYRDFKQKLIVEPGQVHTVHIVMVRDPSVKYSSVTAEVKLQVTPGRAGVFLDDAYVGPAEEFGGVGRAMLVNPGKHRIKIALPGYQTFETEVNLIAKQKFTLKTDLIKGSITQSSPLVRPPQ